MAASYFTREVINEFADLKRNYPNGIPDDIFVMTKLFKANSQFILDLKKMGYTFIDLGGASGSVSYDMEIDKIFN